MNGLPMNGLPENGLPDAEALCAKLVTQLKPHVKPSTAMIGLYTGGAWLAERLHAQLDLATPLGLMDIAFYRDDYHKQGLHHDPKRTRIGFEVANPPTATHPNGRFVYGSNRGHDSIAI